VESLAKALKSDNRNLRFYSVTALGDCEGTRAIIPLISALEDKSWIVRRQAAEALEKYGQTAVPYLKQAFKKGGPDLKFWSIKLLSKLMGGEAVNEFIPILESENEDMRYYALEALGEIRNDEIVPIVVKRLSDPSWIIRKLAAGILSGYGSKIVDDLVPLLTDQDEDCRYWVIKILGKMGNIGVDCLLDHLSKSDKKTKQFIIAVLGEMDDERVVKALIKCLDDENWPVRNQACEALARFESKAIEPLLMTMINHSCNSDLQFWGKKLLDKNIKYIKGALGRLINLDERVKTFLMEAYPDLFEGQMLDILLTGDQASFEKARRLIIKSPEKYMDDLIRYINPSTEAESLTRLMNLAAEINSPALIPAFLSIIETSSESILLSALDFFQKQDDDQVLEAVLGLLDHPSEKVRSRAVSYLSGHEIEEVRYKFISILATEAPENQKIIMEYLGLVSDPIYMNNMLELAENTSAEVCDFAQRSIQRMAERAPELVIDHLHILKGGVLIQVLASLRKRVQNSSGDYIRLVNKMGQMLDSDDSNTVRTVLAALEGQAPDSMAEKLETIFITGGLPEKRVFLDSFSNHTRFRTPLFLAKMIETAEAGTAISEWCKERINSFETADLNIFRENAGRKGMALIAPAMGTVSAGQAGQPGSAAGTSASGGVSPAGAVSGAANAPNASGGVSLSGGSIAAGSVMMPPAGAAGAVNDADVDEEKEVKAILTLAKPGNTEAVQVLLSKLAINNTTIQAQAIDALGTVKDPSAIDYLKKFSETASWVLKAKVYEVLSMFDAELTAEFLISKLTDENQIVRKKVAKVLGDMKSAVVIEKALILFDDPEFEYFTEIHQIFRLSGDIALRVLAPHLSSKNVALRKNVAEFFIEEGAYVTQYLVETIKEDNVFHRKECTRVLQEIGQPAIQYLEQVRHGKPTHIRRWILQTMRKIESNKKF
jgi:HEAT repeat protein